MALIRTDGRRIRRVVLARPEARNAVSAGMIDELLEALRDAAGDPESRAVVLTGEGPDFCAGADIAELDQAAGGPGGAEYGRRFEEVLEAIVRHPVPVIAAIHGGALGAGCQIAVACDLAIASTDARIGIPSARLGIFIGLPNIERLVLAVGQKRAAELLFTGRALSGSEAAGWGLVNETVEGGRLEARVSEVAGQVADAAPLSVGGSKRGIVQTLTAPRDEGSSREFERIAAEVFASEDLREGIRAFRERRRPEFRGR